jgi:two-component system, cell cycle response regulator
MTKRCKILIADDDRVPRTILRSMLENWGHEVIEATDGREAWEILQDEDPPRIAILDWMMPRIDGIELCRHLRSASNLPFIYAILLTNKREEEDLIYALDNGAHDFQSKPARAGELKARIAVGKRLIDAQDRLQESLRQMEKLAATDPLTGIANRRHFFTHATSELKRAYRYQHSTSVLLIDVDGFKKINDDFGHDAGDAALLHITQLCQTQMRENDLFGRFGGDEFSALLIETGPVMAHEAAERLRHSLLKNPVVIGSQTLNITITIGIASVNECTTTIDALLIQADQALLTAKRSGRNRIMHFANSINNNSINNNSTNDDSTNDNL